MNRRSFLQGLAASFGVLALPEVSLVGPAWSPDRLVEFHAAGMLEQTGVAQVRIMRGDVIVGAFVINTFGSCMKWIPPLEAELIGSELTVEADYGAMAAAAFVRPDGSMYVKATA